MPYRSWFDRQAEAAYINFQREVLTPLPIDVFRLNAYRRYLHKGPTGELDMAKRKPDNPVGDLFTPSSAAPTPPAFTTLLANPIVTPLPDQFDTIEEAAHLLRLWSQYPKLQTYRFDRFVSAGGSGMVFKVFGPGATSPRALKIARLKL